MQYTERMVVSWKVERRLDAYLSVQGPRRDCAGTLIV
jgi:hypothetical protein